MAYNKNIGIGPNNVVNISGSIITITGSLTGSEFSGSRLQSTIVSASVVSASQYIGLNTASLNVNNIDFNPQSADLAFQSGRLFYRDSGSLTYWTENPSVNIDVGQQVVVRCQNESGGTLTKGKVVYITTNPSSTDLPRITTASCVNETQSAKTLGLVMADATIGSVCYVILYGILEGPGLDTSAYTSGQMLYLTSSGDFTGTPPVAPLHNVRIGQVVRAQNGNGKIFVRVQNGYELDEIHDVSITSKQDGDLLVQDGTTGLWKNSKILSGSYQIINDLTASGISASNISIIDVSSSQPALRVTQRGDGPAILVEDSANPDSSPFIVDANGNVGIGLLTASATKMQILNTSVFSNTSSLKLQHSQTSFGGNYIEFTKGASTSQGIIGFPSNSSSDFVLRNQQSLGGFSLQASGSVSRLAIDSGGNVGINTVSPNARLHVSGSAIIDSNLTVSGSITELSTRKIKKDITSLNNELKTVSKLNPVSYTRIDDGRREYGFISEEMRQVYPEFVVGEGINYPKMVSVLVSAVKEITQKLEDQNKEIKLLKNKLNKRGKK